MDGGREARCGVEREIVRERNCHRSVKRDRGERERWKKLVLS